MFVSQLFAALWASAVLLIPGTVACNADKQWQGGQPPSFTSQCLRTDKKS